MTYGTRAGVPFAFGAFPPGEGWWFAATWAEGSGPPKYDFFQPTPHCWVDEPMKLVALRVHLPYSFTQRYFATCQTRPNGRPLTLAQISRRSARRLFMRCCRCRVLYLTTIRGERFPPHRNAK